MSYTKGKWKAVETEDGWAVKLIEKGWQIGECFICQEVCQGEDDGEADAKLIAAAPMLFEALNNAPIVSQYSNAENFIAAFEKWRDKYKLPAIESAVVEG